MKDGASHLGYHVQLTTDGHKPHLSAIEDAFGADLDYATLTNICGAAVRSASVAGRRSHRPARPEAHFHVLRGASEPHDGEVHAPVGAADECVHQKDREPRRWRGTLLRVLNPGGCITSRATRD